MAKTATTANKHRSDELRTLLEHRRRELTQDVHGRIREARVEECEELRDLAELRERHGTPRRTVSELLVG